MAGLFVHSLLTIEPLFCLESITWWNSNDFTQTLGSNIWDHVIQWNLLMCRHTKRSV